MVSTHLKNISQNMPKWESSAHRDEHSKIFELPPPSFYWGCISEKFPALQKIRCLFSQQLLGICSMFHHLPSTVPSTRFSKTTKTVSVSDEKKKTVIAPNLETKQIPDNYRICRIHPYIYSIIFHPQKHPKNITNQPNLRNLNLFLWLSNFVRPGGRSVSWNGRLG